MPGSSTIYTNFSYLVVLFIFYLPMYTLSDFFSIMSQISGLFLSCWHWTTTTLTLIRTNLTTRFSFCLFPGFLAIFISFASNNNNSDYCKSQPHKGQLQTYLQDDFRLTFSYNHCHHNNTVPRGFMVSITAILYRRVSKSLITTILYRGVSGCPSIGFPIYQ